MFDTFGSFGPSTGSMHGMHTGMPGMQGMGGGMPGMTNLPGMSGFSPRQDAAVEHDLPVTFEDLLSGANKKMKITREVIIPGSSSTRSEQKILEINVKKGWKEGTKITFPKEGNQSMGKTPADIVFIIKDKPHDRFKRDQANNLTHKVRVTLREALTGTEIKVKSLSGQLLSHYMSYITPQTKYVFKGEGLPLPKQSNVRADLMIEFDIQFPNNLNQGQREELARFLPK